MRIVLLNQFYPPDLAPTGVYLHDVGSELVRRGHRVTVIASSHGYGGDDTTFSAQETIDGVEVIRLPGLGFGRGSNAGKLAAYAGYYTRLAVEVARRTRAELYVALTTPPFLGLLARLAAGIRRARHAHWVMDLYPDVMQAHGMGTPVLMRVLEQFARASYAGAHSVITLGPAMAERTQRYVSGTARVRWVPLWTPPDLSPWPDAAPVSLRAERGWETDRLVLLYSGNFGLGHRFAEFLGAAERFGPTGPRWVFAGEGKARPILDAFCSAHPELPVTLLPYAPAERLREHLCSADVHLISMDSRWEGMLLPSKLQASMAVGKPVIFVGSATQDIARWLAESGAGWVVGENDVDGLLRAVQEARDPAQRGRRAVLAIQFARERFDRNRNLQAMIELLGAG